MCKSHGKAMRQSLTLTDALARGVGGIVGLARCTVLHMFIWWGDPRCTSKQMSMNTDRNRIFGPSDGQATIHYWHNGRMRRWTIGCHIPCDNETTLRAHLERWISDAEFISCEIYPLTCDGDKV